MDHRSSVKTVLNLRKTGILGIGMSAAALLASSGCYSRELPERPNILIIITDQQSAGSIGAFTGRRYLNTPRMDELVRHGIVFNHAYCANPLCIPSRSSLFTGRYPFELGIQANENKIIDPDEFPSLGTIFKNAGYETGYVGKWHLPYKPAEPGSHGFYYLAENKGNGVDSLLPGSAIRFLEARRNSPFFLVVSFVNPHNICQWARGQDLPDGEIGDPPPPDKCPPKKANSLPSSNESDIMRLLRESYQASPVFPVSGFDDAKWRQYLWAYYRMIEKTDERMGKILSFLTSSGLDENTLIVFMADHGDCQGAHRWNQKTVFFEESVNVPLIFSYKGFKSRISDFPVQTGIDLLPTLCGFANMPVPDYARGISLKQLIMGNIQTEKREFIVVSDHLVQGEAVHGQKPQPEGRMLRNYRFKYWIYNEGWQRETLYDLKYDRGEMRNLANDPEFEGELKNCRRQLSEWAEKNRDPFVKFLIR